MRWTGHAQSGEVFLAEASAALAADAGDGRVLASIFAQSARHAALWKTDEGQILLVACLERLLDLLADGSAVTALDVTTSCPAEVAAIAVDMLLAAFFPQAVMGDPAEMDDAALLCLALLLGRAGRPSEAAQLLNEAQGLRSEAGFVLAARYIVHAFRPSSGDEPFKLKLLIWDLDDTLWHGTLADGDKPVLHDRRAAFVQAFNCCGVVSAICSKNDYADARAMLEGFGLWDAFVFPRIAFVPKGPVVRQMIADMQLRPANVLFIDDNVRNLQEVAAAVPGIHTVDANSPECDRLLDELLAANRHVEKCRIADYRLLEERVSARDESGLTDEAFLIESRIEASYTHRMDNLDFAERIEELINRSNQLNYTQTRVAPGEIRDIILNVTDYDVFSAFVWDRYGYYGLVGVAVYDRRSQSLAHLAFSCRIMHMGVEDYLLRALGERFPHMGLGALRKPLPAQGSAAITHAPFERPDVRARILAAEAPRDWSRIRLRLMCDCQSGAFHHYSRNRDVIDFDNIPRVFTLPMMLTGAWADQSFPDYLVYTPSTDYMDWRWREVMPVIDPNIYADCMARFADLIVGANRRLLLFLPPENAPDARYAVLPNLTASEMMARNRDFNARWRALAMRHPDRMRFIDLGDFVGDADMVGHAYHYVPSVLQRMAGLIDDWFEGEEACALAAE